MSAYPLFHLPRCGEPPLGTVHLALSYLRLPHVRLIRHSDLARGSSIPSDPLTASAPWPGGWFWALPGHGEPCGRSSNAPLRYAACPKGHVVPYVDACDSRGCPMCWRKGWLARESGQAGEILIAESRVRKTDGRRSGIIHVSINPPENLYHLVDARAGFLKLRARAYRAARVAGVDGGCCIFHRVRCADRDDPVETDGPHFHVIGFGWLHPGERGKPNRSGWVVKNHGLRLNASGVVGTIRYALSHSHRAERAPPAEGILQEGKSSGLTLSVTWFGRSVSTYDLPEEARFCPECRASYPTSEWTRVEWIGQGPPPDKPTALNWTNWVLAASLRVM